MKKNIWKKVMMVNNSWNYNLIIAIRRIHVNKHRYFGSVVIVTESTKWRMKQEYSFNNNKKLFFSNTETEEEINEILCQNVLLQSVMYYGKTNYG